MIITDKDIITINVNGTPWFELKDANIEVTHKNVDVTTTFRQNDKVKTLATNLSSESIATVTGKIASMVLSI